MKHWLYPATFYVPVIGMWAARQWFSLIETLPFAVLAWVLAAVILLRLDRERP